MVTLTVNGKSHEVSAEADTPLLWVLRGELKLVGSKFGCGKGLCGACVVHVDHRPVRSCLIPLRDAMGAEITTIEGIQGKEIEALRRAWTEIDVVQCGYCQSGQLMSAAALLKAIPKPTRQDINDAMTGNICRCGTYPRIIAAIDLAVFELAAKNGDAS